MLTDVQTPFLGTPLAPLKKSTARDPRAGDPGMHIPKAPDASAQWRPDGSTIHAKKCLLGAGVLGAPPISLTSARLGDPRARDPGRAPVDWAAARRLRE